MTQTALSAQHGGTHYKGMGIQPIEFAVANDYDAAAFSTLKYISRHARKNGAEDLNKGLHFVQIRLELICKIGILTAASDEIPVGEYCRSNDLPELESAILTDLHYWAMRRSNLTDAACAKHIIQKIELLRDTRYPNAKD